MSSGKKEIVDAILESGNFDNAKLSKAVVKDIVDMTFESVINLTSTSGLCRIAKFGTFNRKMRKARMATHPKTGEPIQIAEKQTVKFSAGSDFKDAVQDD
ncbi:MAG TPA: DNA-binding protein [Proteobacteria bacterium]|jgi:DNA-binding protein HU-beta|nr:DNA-binding protein [Pseudomonadota bacterium]|tara:strand:- start:208 stop:507 length:300 start_codon:yes stop_codon:yes gene_type:complete